MAEALGTVNSRRRGTTSRVMVAIGPKLHFVMAAPIPEIMDDFCIRFRLGSSQIGTSSVDGALKCCSHRFSPLLSIVILAVKNYL
jgi:hypothetical protein